MTAPALITIREAGGRVVGPLHMQGAGGAVLASGRHHVERAIRHATAGRALQIAEFAPGHARMMLAKPAADEGVTMVDLRGAQIVGWS